MSKRLAIALAAACAIGCGEGKETFELDDGSTVVVTESGDIEIRANGLRLWSLGSERPTARQFDEDVLEGLGMWQFTRTNVVETRYGDKLEVVGGTSDVTVTYGDGDARATVTIRPGDVGTTRLSLTVEPGATSIALPLACDDDSSFYGFGAQYNGTDQRGESFPLFVSEQGIGRTGAPFAITGDAHTTYFPMPYFVDARGHGALLETPRRVHVELCDDDDTAWFEVIDERPIELVLFHGPTPADVVRQLGALVGRPAAPPAWALGVWIGAQGGTAAVDAIADELEAEAVPATALWVQDWTGVRTNADGGSGVEYRWEVDDTHYVDLPGQVAALRARGFRFLAYANSFIDPDLDNHWADMDSAGLLIRNAAGASYNFGAPNGTSSLPDLTNPAAREYVKDALRAMVNDMGFDGWMSDFGEWLPLDAVLSDGTAARDYHNLYPVEWHRLWREVMDELRPDGDYAVFARSGFTGVHATAQIYWIGDQETSFSATDGLPTVVPAMLNLGLSGIPFVTHDIAGFSSFDGPSTKELYMRWTELGAFTPIMRTHEGNEKDANWNWNADPETIAHFRRFARIHQALAAELQALAADAEQTSMPLVRHLMLEFPGDEQARAISDQYMLGPDLLVAPITTDGTRSREVYLPEGTWFHVWSGTSFAGSSTHEIAAELGEIPVFSRDRDRPDLRSIE